MRSFLQFRRLYRELYGQYILPMEREFKNAQILEDFSLYNFPDALQLIQYPAYRKIEYLDALNLVLQQNGNIKMSSIHHGHTLDNYLALIAETNKFNAKAFLFSVVIDLEILIDTLDIYEQGWSYHYKQFLHQNVLNPIVDVQVGETFTVATNIK